ncbi:MAG: cytochrome b/b6 domain-containing protein [Caulobacteraceae bacterium]|nr:cytochrome b/b6 domain-containing protein [Caulobacteraceae bacterium]
MNQTTAQIDVRPSAPHRRRAQGREVIHRHGVVVRVTHWINVVAVSLLLMSGLQIFNAHPNLYWGQYGADFDRPLLEMRAVGAGTDHPVGVTEIAGHVLRTTGLFGVSGGRGGQPEVRGFPRWATLPSWRDLATGRRWHFFLAWVLVINGLVYLLSGVASGHFRRDLAPTRSQLRPSHILRDIWDHVRLRHPTGEAAKSYNVLQKFAYIAVVFVLLPAMVATGLTLSPGFDAFAPWLLDLFGGRQSARTLHFISANLIVLFVLVHVAEVFIAGVFNEVGSMITGRYAIRTEAGR